jgi:orotate phosphoribosyltransferase
VLLAEGHRLVGEVLFEVLKNEPIVAVAGVELGGCPLASAVAVTSALAGHPLDALYVRKDAKDHGSKRLIEGSDHLQKGAQIALLEDVVTTGGSTLKAVAKLHEAGFVVRSVWALVDRQEGGAEAIRQGGLRFEAVFGRSDFPR